MNHTTDTRCLPNRSRKFLFMYWTIFSITIISACSTKEKMMYKESEVLNEMNSLIQTEVDSQYVYAYAQSKFVPPAGKVLLFQGQTYERINDYIYDFGHLGYPSGWSAYWAITEFTGVTQPYKNITGSTQNHQFLVDGFSDMALHSAMWMVGKWDVAKKTGEGVYDRVIKQYCDWVKSIDRPVYLRIGYEFDGPHNELEPAEYVKAYKRIVDIMRSEGVENVAFVWHSYASKPYKNYQISEWYPGDEYVDWVAISVFFQPYEGIEHKETNTVLQFAKSHQKPVMIAEANPVLGIEKGDEKVWEEWFANFFTFTYAKNIKAICFINEDWTELKIDGISEWKDARLNSNSLVAKAWFQETAKERYLKKSPQLFEQLGY